MKSAITKNNEGWKKEKKQYAYYFKEKKAGQYNIRKMVFIGYSDIPKGFQLYKTGGGFNVQQSNRYSGDSLLQYLKKKYKSNIEIFIYKNENTKAIIEKLQRKNKISLSEKSFLFLIKDLGVKANEYKNDIIENRLSKVFKYRYVPRNDNISLDEIVSKIDLSNLDGNDHKAIIKMVKEYHKLYSKRKEIEELAKSFIISGKKETLARIVLEYSRNLKDKDFSEKKWQDYLQKKVFPFLTNYIESFRETDVNVGDPKEGEKKPDFVWIDLYGFLDIFEIKTPYKDILAKRIDSSHSNYYFSTEVIKAISQIEKYLLFLERNVEKYKASFEKKTRINFTVIRPKAFLLIGNSAEFDKNAKKKNDFRLLRRSLKNIEIITYNELLDNLKNMLNKIEQQ